MYNTKETDFTVFSVVNDGLFHIIVWDDVVVAWEYNRMDAQTQFGQSSRRRKTDSQDFTIESHSSMSKRKQKSRKCKRA